MNKYILDGKTPVVENDVIKWAEWFEKADRHVAENIIGEVVIATVFLGLGNNWGKGKPILFETMIFGGEHDGYRERYYAWEEAENGHEKAVKLVKETK